MVARKTTIQPSSTIQKIVDRIGRESIHSLLFGEGVVNTVPAAKKNLPRDGRITPSPAPGKRVAFAEPPKSAGQAITIAQRRNSARILRDQLTRAEILFLFAAILRYSRRCVEGHAVAKKLLGPDYREDAEMMDYVGSPRGLSHKKIAALMEKLGRHTNTAQLVAAPEARHG